MKFRTNITQQAKLDLFFFKSAVGLLGYKVKTVWHY